MVVFVAWLPLLSIAVFSRIYSKSWFSPIASWSGYWALITLIAIINPLDYKMSPRAILFIELMVFFFCLGGLFFSYKTIKNIKVESRNIAPYFYWTLGGSSLFCCIVVIWFYLRSTGYSFHAIFSQILLLSSVSHDISILRYYESNPYSNWINLFSLPIYANVFFFGFIFSKQDIFFKGKAIVFSIPLISAVLITLLTTAKMSILMTLFFFLGSYITGKIIFRRKLDFTKKEVLVILLIIFSVILISIMSLFLRYKAMHSSIPLIYNRIFDGFTGFLAGFSAWFEQFLDGRNEKIDYWGFTFQWIRNIIDTGDRPQGLFFPIYEYNGYGTSSNIFTIYRCLIEDFSLPGAIVVLILSSYFFSNAYCRLLQGSVRTIHWVCMLFYYPILFYSFIFMVFGYTTSAASIFLGCILIRYLVNPRYPQEKIMKRYRYDAVYP